MMVYIVLTVDTVTDETLRLYVLDNGDVHALQGNF